MNKILIATKNPGKLLEIKKFLSDFSLQIVSLSDVGITEDIDETGKTYEENSVRKAIFYSKKSNLPSIADDGGLEIEALNGEPGVKSRRWLGHEGTDEELIEHMSNVSKNLTDDNRKAFFRTVISFALPNGKVWSVDGQVEGIIVKKPYMKHSRGYPYRSFFYLPQIKNFIMKAN